MVSDSAVLGTDAPSTWRERFELVRALAGRAFFDALTDLGAAGAAAFAALTALAGRFESLEMERGLAALILLFLSTRVAVRPVPEPGSVPAFLPDPAGRAVARFAAFSVFAGLAGFALFISLAVRFALAVRFSGFMGYRQATISRTIIGNAALCATILPDRLNAPTANRTFLLPGAARAGCMMPMKMSRLCAFLLAFAILPAFGAVDYFLELDGVPGESTDAVHANTIEVETFTFGVKNPATIIAGAGSSAGKATFSEISFTKAVDRSSPLLYLHCAQGKHISKAVLYGRNGGESGRGDDFYVITLEDVLVSSIQTGGPSNGIPMETLSLNFTKIHVSYRPLLPDGRLGDPVRFGWDLATNGSYSP